MSLKDEDIWWCTWGRRHPVGLTAKSTGNPVDA
jgi:hypothetical protein